MCGILRQVDAEHNVLVSILFTPAEGGETSAPNLLRLKAGDGLALNGRERHTSLRVSQPGAAA